MNKLTHLSSNELFGNRIKNFQKVMRFKVRDILLVSSLYDFYLFEEDGRLYDLIRQEYQVFNLSHAPEITHVSTGGEAIELASENHYDLIITTLHVEDMHVTKLAEMIRQNGIDTPIIILAYDNQERKDLTTNYDTSIFERIFIWQGDYRILIGIIKYVEDKMNVANDTALAGVQVIILVEDNVKFYSSYLPLIYAEIFKQSQRLISEGINLTHKFLRMRARPKILLCSTYEEAWDNFEKYREYILGIITDINFRYGGEKDAEAGIKFAKNVLALHSDIPILLQSSNDDYEKIATQIGASFVLKGSPRLLHEVSEFMINNFGFGDFIFRIPEGKQVGRANNLIALAEMLKIVPEDSIKFHAERNHFSNWMKARTEFWLAHRLRPRKVTDFASVEELRLDLINSINLFLEIRQKGIITDFSKDTFDPENSFARIGGGSLGGKARGLGFVNMLITNYDIANRFDDVRIYVPSAVVLGTDVFDQFMEENKLTNIALSTVDDIDLMKIFLDAKYFPEEVLKQLKEFLEIVNKPLAVRSSSLLEDSQFQPFAGVYQTYMIPNSVEDSKQRLDELLQSIKCVYASTFFKAAKNYMKATQYRLEEEKMAVVIQKLIGTSRNEKFYPDFAGVAKSYNFYPVAPQKSQDGIAMAALGLGKTVVDGGNSVRFCPKYPKHLLQFFSVQETVKSSQQDFYALDLKGKVDHATVETHDTLVKKYDLSDAEDDGSLGFVGSTYSPENDSVHDGISRKGKRVITFAPVLKNKIFPLPEILDLLLATGSWGMGTPIEIEFAVNMSTPKGKPKEFGMLQMRPLVLTREVEEIHFGKFNSEDLICISEQVLGNGTINEIHDVVAVDFHKFDRAKSRETANEVSQLNTKLIAQKRQYILIGVGRWGTLDPWLGIPVTWDQISGAAVIVESGFKDLSVTPSQGSHFFQNITSFRVGYFTVNSYKNTDFVDWDWLTAQKPAEELEFTRHLHFEKPIVVKMNGQQNKGIILKPEGK
ncbi:MAG: histidine kinase [Ignavibacteriaceae bacterium]|jgi:CheY-like chemotaxis protein|nr:histidine kinase [Ignavibacteriaceae bacterium]